MTKHETDSHKVKRKIKKKIFKTAQAQKKKNEQKYTYQQKVSKPTKADAKKAPKIPTVKPSMNISPYDIANMVQQKFKQDMDADNTKIQKRQREIQAERRAIQSPEYRQQLDEQTKSKMSLHHEMELLKDDVARVQVEARRAFERSPMAEEMMNELATIRRQTQHSEEMRKSESEKIMSEIERKIQSTEKAWEQRLEKAQIDRENQHMKQVNDRLDKLEDEKAKYEARVSDAKGAARAEGLKRTQKKVEQNAQAAAKVRVQAEHEEETLAITKEGQKNIRRQAYIKVLQEEGPKLRAAEGEAMAKAELENQRLESEMERERKKQKLLLEKEGVVKQLAQQKEEMIQHLQKLRQNDPSSRIIGDASVFEADLYMLGPEQERYKELYRQQLETIALQNVVLSQDREIKELQQQIDTSKYGLQFERLYGKDPERMVKALGDLAQIRQGRAILWEDMESIFPNVKDVQQRQEARAEALARRGSELTSREEAVGAREQRMNEIDDQRRESQIIIQRQDQQIADYQQQLAAYQQAYG